MDCETKELQGHDLGVAPPPPGGGGKTPPPSPPHPRTHGCWWAHRRGASSSPSAWARDRRRRSTSFRRSDWLWLRTRRGEEDRAGDAAKGEGGGVGVFSCTWVAPRVRTAHWQHTCSVYEPFVPSDILFPPPGSARRRWGAHVQGPPSDKQTRGNQRLP